MDRLFIPIPQWPDQPPLETSSLLPWVTVLVSVVLNLLFAVLIPQPKLQYAVGQQKRILQLRMKPVADKKVRRSALKKRMPAMLKASGHTLLENKSRSCPPPEVTVVKTPSGAPMISIGEALRQTLIDPTNFNNGIRCTHLQRHQRLINCDDIHMVSEIGRLTGSNLSRSFDVLGVTGDTYRA